MPSTSRAGTGARERARHARSGMGAAAAAAGAALLLAGPVHAGWVDSAWTYRQRVTISASVAASDLTDFPYLIAIADPANPLFANGQGDGNDIVFTTSDGTTRLDHEIEHYDAVAGELVAWVRFPLLSSAADTELFLYYGNGAVSSQENVPGVWTSAYEAVWHLHDDFDDVAGGHDGVNAGSIDAPGILADAQDFEPDDGLDSLEVGTWSVPGSALTLEAWVYPDEDFLINDPRVVSKAASSDPQDHVHMLSLTDGTLGENRLRCRVKTGTDDATGTTTFAGTAPNGYLPAKNVWYHVAMTYDGSLIRIVRDGLDGGSTAKTGALRENGWRVLIGNVPVDGTATFANWEGKIDEVRVSSVARSQDWLRTEYLNQGTPATYQTLGPEEIELVLVKRAFDAAGNPIASLETVASGTVVTFLIYVNNPGPVYTDASVRDILDSAFGYEAGTIRADGSLGACAAPGCSPAEEEAILGAVSATAPLTDGPDGDVASYDGVTRTIDAGDEHAANAALDIGAGSVWAMSFAVTIE